MKEINDILEKYKKLDHTDPEIDLEDITWEVIDLSGEFDDDDTTFNLFLEMGKESGLVSVECDGWEWINPITGIPYD